MQQTTPCSLANRPETQKGLRHLHRHCRPNRKAVIAEGKGAHIQSFLKIALNDRSAENVANEYNSLCLLRHLPIKNLVIPTVSALDRFSIRVSNVKPVSRGCRVNSALVIGSSSGAFSMPL